LRHVVFEADAINPMDLNVFQSRLQQHGGEWFGAVKKNRAGGSRAGEDPPFASGQRYRH
jgi:hypothetical protein